MLKQVAGLLIPFIFLAGLTCFGGQAPSSSPSVPASPNSNVQPRWQIFSGYVAEMQTGSVTVARKASQAAPMEKRVFLMDAQTKVEGKLKANARVAVRFESTPNGDRAVKIIVRG